MNIVVLLVLAGLVLAFLVAFFWFIPVGLWISAQAAGVRVPLTSLIAMRLRRVAPARIILPLIKANKAGIDVEQNQLEAHFLAGATSIGLLTPSSPPTRPKSGCPSTAPPPSTSPARCSSASSA